MRVKSFEESGRIRCIWQVLALSGIVSKFVSCFLSSMGVARGLQGHTQTF